MHRPIPSLLRSDWPWLLMTAAVVGGIHHAMVAATPFYFLNNEELHNATVARELLVGNLRHVLDYQYRSFCGGCTAVALIGWLSFAVNGVGYLAWKIVAALFTAGIVIAGHRLLTRAAGRAAAWAFVLLMLGAPTILTQAMSMLWGNHFEVTLLVLVQAALAAAVLAPRPLGRGPGRALWLFWGVVAGLGFWFCFHSAFALPVLALLALFALGGRAWFRGIPWLAAGAAAGLLPLVAYALTTDRSLLMVARFGLVPHEEGVHVHLPPLGEILSMVPVRAWEATLGNYAPVMCGMPGRDPLGIWDSPVLPALWLLALAGAALSLRRRRGWRVLGLIPLALLLADMVGYTVAPWRTDPDPDAFPEPFRMRYLAPVMVLLLASAAVGAGRLWSRGLPGRVVAAMLVALVAIPGLAAKVAWTTASPDSEMGPRARHIPPMDYVFFQQYGAYHLGEETRRSFSSEDWISTVNHHRASGVDLAERLIRGDVAGALAILDEVRADPTRSPEEQRMVLHGLGRALRHQRKAFGVPSADYLPQVAAMLRAADEDERRALAAGIWERNLTLLVDPTDPAPRADPLTLISGPVLAANCSLCPAVGELLAVAPPPGEVRVPGDLIEGGEAALPDDPPLRAAILRGAGAAYGRAHGYRGKELLDVARRFDPADGVPFLEGLAIGHGSTWARSSSRSSPPERVP